MKGTIKSKSKVIFESFIFNLVASVVALYKIILLTISIIKSDNYEGAFWLLIWIVIAYHFISATTKYSKERVEK